MIKNTSTRSNCQWLMLSLAILSGLGVATIKAEARPSTGLAIAELSQKIGDLIDLDPDRQILITAALNRAIASRENENIPVDNVTPAASDCQDNPTLSTPQKSLESCDPNAYATTTKPAPIVAKPMPTPLQTPAPRRLVIRGARG
jgi:hypothetical protein